MSASFRDDVLLGLADRPRRLPSKWLYDERGSYLFEQITHLGSYYVTEAELGILRRHAHEMAARMGPGVELIELGSGASRKTRILLESADVALYVPVDVSREILVESAAALRRHFPRLSVQPVCADFTQDFEIPERKRGARTVVFFPGSTIGNFEPRQAEQLLESIRRMAGEDGYVLVGFDLKKDPAVLHRAYNDEAGLTAAFNKNVLVRINRELGANFYLDQFRHYAHYVPEAGRIEMTLVSSARQSVMVQGSAFDFDEGEAIVSEHSYKYGLPDIASLATRAGFALEDVWLDERRYFAVVGLRAV